MPGVSAGVSVHRLIIHHFICSSARAALVAPTSQRAQFNAVSAAEIPVRA